MGINFINQRSRTRAQSMVEFALVMPILLLLVYGMFEVGRVVFMYGMVITASREAVRYGSATGLNQVGGIPKYRDCDGIRNAAQKVDFLGVIDDVNVVIAYDHGPGTAEFSVCPPGVVVAGDRIKVQVSADFYPIVPIIPWAPWTIVSDSARTILTDVDIMGTVQPPPPGPTRTPTGTPTPGEFPTDTKTPTQTLTPTYTINPFDTPTATWTPTLTTTHFVCDVKHSGPIQGGADVTWTIYNNSGIPLEINLMVIFWQSYGGRVLTYVYLGGEQLWYGNTNASGFSVPGQPFTLPTGATGLRLVFTKSTSNIQVVLTFSTHGCSAPLDSDNPNQVYQP
ncbi:MAG: TadE/TadG family type IV pilus assembly protein [Chloroflexota bacterium]